LRYGPRLSNVEQQCIVLLCVVLRKREGRRGLESRLGERAPERQRVEREGVLAGREGAVGERGRVEDGRELGAVAGAARASAVRDGAGVARVGRRLMHPDVGGGRLNGGRAAYGRSYGTREGVVVKHEAECLLDLARTLRRVALKDLLGQRTEERIQDALVHGDRQREGYVTDPAVGLVLGSAPNQCSNLRSNLLINRIESASNRISIESNQYRISIESVSNRIESSSTHEPF